MALEFDGTGTEVTLMESGGLEYDPVTQSLYEGENVGRPTYPLETNRLRFCGGIFSKRTW